MAAPRVLVVDDSAFARTVLSRVLRAAGIDVIGTARDGDDALAQIAEHDPDVVTLDLTMPGRDGLDVLRALEGKPRPRMIVVSVSTIDSVPGAEALSLGAIDIVSKPSALATDRLYELGNELVQKVLAAAPAEAVPTSDAIEAPLPVGVVRHADLVLIGTSTGGPQALTRLLAALPADLAAPVAVVLHIPVGYTEALARRLDQSSPLEVVEASQGIELRPGRVVLARAGQHLKLARRNGTIVGHLDAMPVRPHTPAVDELFLSGAEVAGPGTLGVVLTGMGDDGLLGARAIHAAGGSLLTESPGSCVVYGMPRCVYEANLGARSAPLETIHREIIRHVSAR
ncbi:MAG: chemotaxis-specific protein-glutamate methyltransferase CheB [Kofleriaceae bacterium]|nr:chemotaxis-specific protein-glutamate methyltransferase CheB [Kofleriaceae bacterium]